MKKCLMLLAAASFMFSGCGGSADPKPAASNGAAGEGALEIAVIPKGLTHQFWVTVRAGAEAAAKELGATVVWQGPTKETEIDRQVSIVQDMINRRVDGIVLAACDENALVNSVAQAEAAGIPVVTFDSGVKSDLPRSFVATDNIDGARQAAGVLAELIGGEGEVGQIPFVPGAATSELREQGFRKGVAEHPGMKLAATNYSQSDVSMGMNVTTDMLTAFPNIKGIFASNEPGAIGAAQALRALGKAGQIKLVAFDASGEQINALKDGVIQALIVQNPFKMGYEGVRALVASIKGEPVDKIIDTGVTIVTKDNLDDPEIQKLLGGMS